MKRIRRWIVTDGITVAMVLGLLLIIFGSWWAYATLPCDWLGFLPASEVPGRCFR